MDPGGGGGGGGHSNYFLTGVCLTKPWNGGLKSWLQAQNIGSLELQKPWNGSLGGLRSERKPQNTWTLEHISPWRQSILLNYINLYLSNPNSICSLCNHPHCLLYHSKSWQVTKPACESWRECQQHSSGSVTTGRPCWLARYSSKRCTSRVSGYSLISNSFKNMVKMSNLFINGRKGHQHIFTPMLLE